MKHLLALMFLAFCSCAYSQGCENRSLEIFGASRHAERNKNYNEENAGVGLRFYGKEKFFLCPFVEANYIARNSLRGKAHFVGAGAEFVLRNNTVPIGLVLSARIGKLAYEIPNRGTMRETVPILSVGVDYRGYRFNATPFPGVTLFSVTVPF